MEEMKTLMAAAIKTELINHGLSFENISIDEDSAEGYSYIFHVIVDITCDTELDYHKFVDDVSKHLNLKSPIYSENVYENPKENEEGYILKFTFIII